MFLEYKKKLAEKKKIKANEHVSSRIEGQREQRERMKQTKLQFASSKAPSKLSVNEQKAVDQTLLNYFISKAVPLSHVDDPSFIALMNTMNPRANIMGCKKLRSLIKEEKQAFLADVKDKFKTTDYVCLTGDLWGSSHRSWFGLTGHFINTEDFSRVSYPICCRRMKGELSSC